MAGVKHGVGGIDLAVPTAADRDDTASPRLIRNVRGPVPVALAPGGNAIIARTPQLLARVVTVLVYRSAVVVRAERREVVDEEPSTEEPEARGFTFEGPGFVVPVPHHVHAVATRAGVVECVAVASSRQVGPGAAVTRQDLAIEFRPELDWLQVGLVAPPAGASYAPYELPWETVAAAAARTALIPWHHEPPRRRSQPARGA